MPSLQIWRLPPWRLRDFKGDLPAGAVGGLAAIPDGLAAAVMTGVNPIHGLYASIVGRVTGGLTTGSAMMCVTTTGAISITAAAAMEGVPEEAQAGTLAMLVLLVGIVQLTLGVLRLGFLVRFVSNTVTTGFLFGVAVSIVLSQLEDLTAYASGADHQLERVYALVTHLGEVHLPTLLVGVLTIVTVPLLEHTRAANLAMLIALTLTTVLTHTRLFGLDEVRLVGDTYDIPSGVPLPILPDITAFPQVAFTAVAVAVVGLLQGAGLTHGYPNPDGRYGSPSADFRGQGIANIACALLRGLPVGGSLGQTALLADAGARTRWATIISGLTALLAILLVAPLVSALPMAAVAGLLVIVGYRAVPSGQIRVIWGSGAVNALVMIMTFIATLLLPIEQAVALGVMVTFVLQIFRSANRLKVREMRLRPDNLFEVGEPPAALRDRDVCILYPSGSLFFAGAQVLESQLPDPGDADRPVVILILRDRTEVGSTFLGVIDRYGRRLQKRGGRLMLVGVGERVQWQLERTGLLSTLGPDNVYPVTSVIGDPLIEAQRAARAWLDANGERRADDERPADEPRADDAQDPDQDRADDRRSGKRGPGDEGSPTSGS